MAKLRRGLMGLFAIFFLLCGVALVQLTLDEQHDLSSRASSWGVDHKALPIEKLDYFNEDSAWLSTEQQTKLPLRVEFDEAAWNPPMGGDAVFASKSKSLSVRFVNRDLDSNGVATILGANFVLDKKGVAVKGISEDWSVVSYKAKFLKENVLVETWMSKDGLVALGVYRTEADRAEVIKLLSGVRVNRVESKKVKGASDSANDDARIAVLSRPSVVMILSRYCNNLRWNNVQGELLNREYKYCTASVGSGFFVNSDGYIGTNGHVVRVTEPMGMAGSLKSGGLKDLAADILLMVYAQAGAVPDVNTLKNDVERVYASQESLAQLYGIIISLRDKGNLKLGAGDYNYYVQLSNEPIVWDKNGMVTASDKVISATFVDADFDMNVNSEGFNGSDVALLKVDGGSYPALPLGNADDLEVADTIQVVGFPGVASSLSASGSWLLDSSSNAEPSITKGVVSAFKNAKGDMKRLIQTDASINHGNSGGPAVNNKGEVVGVATYGLALSGAESGGNFNFLRDVADLKALMEKNAVIPSTKGVYDQWKMGLESYWLSYFKYAKADFDEVVTNYPIHPTVEKYLSEAKMKVGSAEDLTPKFTRNERKTYMTITMVGMVTSALVFLGMVVWEVMDNNAHKRKLATVAPVQTF